MLSVVDDPLPPDQSLVALLVALGVVALACFIWIEVQRVRRQRDVCEQHIAPKVVPQRRWSDPSIYEKAFPLRNDPEVRVIDCRGDGS